MGKLPEGWVETPLENIVEILDSMRIPVNNKERQNVLRGKILINYTLIMALQVKSVKLMILFLMKSSLH